MEHGTIIMDANEVRKGVTSIANFAHDYFKRDDVKDIALMGVNDSGSAMAKLVAEAYKTEFDEMLSTGVIDNTMERDDFSRLNPLEITVGRTILPGKNGLDLLDKKHVLMAYPVIHDGSREVSAMCAIGDYGRPASVGIVTLYERYGRMLPISIAYSYKAETEKTKVDDNLSVRFEKTPKGFVLIIRERKKK